MRHDLECIVMGTLRAVELHRRWLALASAASAYATVDIVSRNERRWRTGMKGENMPSVGFGTEETK